MPMLLTGPQIALCNALKGQDEKLALFAINAVDDVDFYNEDRNLPLHLACVKPWPKVVKALLDKGSKLSAAKTWSGKTALHLAQDNNLLEVAECLVHHSPQLRTQGDLRENSTPLHEAAAQNKLEFLKLYLNLTIDNVFLKCDVNVRDSRQSTALHEAVKMGHVQTVKLLLAHDANPELCDGGACKARVYAEFPRNEAILALLAPKAPSLFSLASIQVIENYEAPESAFFTDIFAQANKAFSFAQENARQQAQAEAKLEKERQAARKMIDDAPKLKALKEGIAKLALGFNG
jgi:ankyrin repeat protein